MSSSSHEPDIVLASTIPQEESRHVAVLSFVPTHLIQEFDCTTRIDEGDGDIVDPWIIVNSSHKEIDYEKLIRMWSFCLFSSLICAKQMVWVQQRCHFAPTATAYHSFWTYCYGWMTSADKESFTQSMTETVVDLEIECQRTVELLIGAGFANSLQKSRWTLCAAQIRASHRRSVM
jgi:hypothetical protein